ncbi:uncharacterized protein [Arachis hypogaea]|uniref:uncharacterized protein n=1 Tax=Arachis hypogaea TaxID=3818 RepID=UPI003B218C32
MAKLVKFCSIQVSHYPDPEIQYGFFLRIAESMNCPSFKFHDQPSLRSQETSLPQPFPAPSQQRLLAPPPSPSHSQSREQAPPSPANQCLAATPPSRASQQCLPAASDQPPSSAGPAPSSMQHLPTPNTRYGGSNSSKSRQHNRQHPRSTQHLATSTQQPIQVNMEPEPFIQVWG